MLQHVRHATRVLCEAQQCFQMLKDAWCMLDRFRCSVLSRRHRCKRAHHNGDATCALTMAMTPRAHCSLHCHCINTTLPRTTQPRSQLRRQLNRLNPFSKSLLNSHLHVPHLTPRPPLTPYRLLRSLLHSMTGLGGPPPFLEIRRRTLSKHAEWSRDGAGGSTPKFSRWNGDVFLFDGVRRWCLSVGRICWAA